jgi:hypothetical protein
MASASALTCAIAGAEKAAAAKAKERAKRLRMSNS